jgi:leucyl-tRNA synthetase
VVEAVFMLLAPFTPHLCEEANALLGSDSSIFRREWLKHDDSFLEEEEVEIPVLVDGKLRLKMVVNVNWDQAQIQEKALANERVQAYLSDSAPKKVVYVPKKILNIVTK